MSQFTICDARAADEEAALALESAAFAELRRIYVPKPSPEARPAAPWPPSARLVAESAGQIIGTVRWRVEGDRLHLRAMAVAREHRRKGVGRAMVEHCAGMAKRGGLRAVSVYTVVETGNVDVFARWGFAVIHEHADSFATTPAGGLVREAYLEMGIRCL